MQITQSNDEITLTFKDIIFNEVIGKLDSLINDVFGNYVV